MKLITGCNGNQECCTFEEFQEYGCECGCHRKIIPVIKQTRRQEIEDELDRFKVWRIKHCELDEVQAHRDWIKILVNKQSLGIVHIKWERKE